LTIVDRARARALVTTRPGSGVVETVVVAPITSEAGVREVKAISEGELPPPIATLLLLKRRKSPVKTMLNNIWVVIKRLIIAIGPALLSLVFGMFMAAWEAMKSLYVTHQP
jgi:hypothetical protein